MSNATDDHCIWHVRDINDLDKNASGGVVEMKAWLVQQGMGGEEVKSIVF